MLSEHKFHYLFHSFFDVVVVVVFIDVSANISLTRHRPNKFVLHFIGAKFSSSIWCVAFVYVIFSAVMVTMTCMNRWLDAVHMAMSYRCNRMLHCHLQTDDCYCCNCAWGYFQRNRLMAGVLMAMTLMIPQLQMIKMHLHLLGVGEPPLLQPLYHVG